MNTKVCLLSTPRVVKGGLGQGNYENFNLAAHTGDDWQAVKHNRLLLMRRFNLPSYPHWLTQTHSNVCVELTTHNTTNTKHPLITADAAISRKKGVVCAVLTADCLPIFASDINGTVVGVCHAGWRGLLAGVIEQFVSQMRVEPACINVYLGAAIGPAAFAVGAEVFDYFTNQDSKYAEAFVNQDSRQYLDIYQLARLILTKLGVINISGGGLCSVYGDYFSYRRQGANSGRHAHLIWLV